MADQSFINAVLDLAGLQQEQWKVRKKASGQPFLWSKRGMKYCSFSDSGNYSAFAISEGPIGIDIETGRWMSQQAYEYIVNEGEKEWFNGSNAIKLFGLKEALSKAYGYGWKLDPKDITVISGGLSGQVREKRFFCNSHERDGITLSVAVMLQEPIRVYIHNSLSSKIWLFCYKP